MDLFYAQNDTSIIDTTFDFSERLKTHDNYFYIEDDIKINDQLNINLGLHLTSFIVKGKNYKSAKPKKNVINLINELYDSGHTIKIFTSRYMCRNKENAKKARYQGYKKTLNQLKKWDLKFI